LTRSSPSDPTSTSTTSTTRPPPGRFASASSSSPSCSMSPSAPSSGHRCPCRLHGLMQAGRVPHPRHHRRRLRHRARVRPRRVPRRARQHGRRPHKPVHRVRCRQLAHGALGAEAEVLNVSPTTCSTQCHNRSTTTALCSVVCPLGVHKTCKLERKLIRYITSCYHPHFIVVVPVEVANYVLEDCMMLDTMSEPNPAIPWQDSNTLISETIRLCFTFWVLFSYGLAGVHKRLPWPPPVPLERLLSMLCCLLDGHIVISNSVTVFGTTKSRFYLE